MPRSQTPVPCARSRTASAIVTATCACLSAIPAYSQVHFNDVSNGAEVTYTGESWGSTWGDVNGDNWPDLFVNHHRNRPSLYVNLANGTFEDRAFEIDEWFVTPRSDTHGGTFADYDNDGDSDLVITAGSKNNTQFLINNGAYLTDRIEDFTFDKKSWGGRLPIWFDFSHDGLLDLGITVQGIKVQLHEQVNGDFERRTWASGHNCVNNDYSQLGDLTLDGLTDWVCYEQARYPQKVYDYSVGMPFIDQSALANPHANVTDSVIADFDNDGIVELFALGGRTRVSGAQATGPNSLEAHLIDRGNGELTVRFRSAGDVEVELHWDARNVNNVHIGLSGVHPPAGPKGEPIRFTLSPTDPQVQGVKPHNPTTEAGVYVGYTASTQTWTYQVSHGYTYTFFVSTQPVSNVIASGLNALDFPRVPAMLKYNSGVYTNQTAAAGLNQALNCVSVVAADFDKDMDLDLYMICRFAISNDANRLYLNDGFGVFTRLPGAGGGEGPVGLGVGLSESVTVGDYDVDGRPDLFVTNGLKLVPEFPYSEAGPDILLRNTSATGNNWIELDLVGVQSNRDAIGATITATAGGVTQTRARDGAYHRWSQNDPRLHFGLGDNATVDVTVHWPSGTTSNYMALPANALYELVEGNPAPVPAVLQGSTPPSVCESTGAPAYTPGGDHALFFWNNFCGSGRYHVRATGGGVANSAFNGLIVSSQPFVNVTGVSLEGPDVLDYSTDPSTISYGLQLNAGGQDGFDFTIPSGAIVCFGVGANSASARAGRNATTVSMPFDLQSLAPCDS